MAFAGFCNGVCGILQWRLRDFAIAFAGFCNSFCGILQRREAKEGACPSIRLIVILGFVV